MLAGDLVKLKLVKASESVDLARDSLEWWLNKHCPFCKGAGVNLEQIECPRCLGSGEKHKPEKFRRVIGIMDAALEWLELQQRKRLAGHEVALPTAVRFRSVLDEATTTFYGWVTPQRPMAE